MPRKTSAPSKSAKKVYRRRNPLVKASISQLTAEIQRRQDAIPALNRKADDLRKQLASVELELKALGSATAAAPARPATKIASAVTKSASTTTKSVGTATKSTGTGKRTRRGKGGGPTLSDRIVKSVTEAKAPIKLRELVATLSKAMGRPADKSFLVQVSATMRRLVDSKAVAQPGRGVYKAV